MSWGSINFLKVSLYIYKLVLIQFVAVSVCGEFGLWSFRSAAIKLSIAISVCNRFVFLAFRSLVVPVCGLSICVRLGFGFSVCGCYDQKPWLNLHGPQIEVEFSGFSQLICSLLFPVESNHRNDNHRNCHPRNHIKRGVLHVISKLMVPI